MGEITELRGVTSATTLMAVSVTIEEDELDVVAPQAQSLGHEEGKRAHFKNEKTLVGRLPPSRVQHLMMNQVGRI